MWALLGHKTQVSVLVASSIVVGWALDGAYKWVTGHPVELLHEISLATFIVGIVLFGVAGMIWRWVWRKVPLLQRLVFPDLNGVWNGLLISTWIDPATGQPKPPIPVTIIIRQTLLSTTVKLATAESASVSTHAVLEANRDARQFKIWYSFKNDPKAQHQHRSAQHEGIASLEIDFDKDARKLTGRYYTTRKTTGDIEVTKKGR